MHDETPPTRWTRVMANVSWITFTLASCFFLCASSLLATDWPQLLGPNRDGVYPGNDLAKSWPKEGPRVLWKKLPIGNGFAAPVVVEGKITRFTRLGRTPIPALILFTRVADNEIVEAINADDGASLWAHQYPTAYRDSFGFDPGPRATPTVAGDKVFTFGADGLLLCLNLDDGKKLWSVDCKNEFGAPKGFFGLACSPLVEGRAVIVNVGGKNTSSLIAFEKETGKVLWRAIDDEPSYSSPTTATIGGQRLVLALTRGNFVGLDPANGKVIFQIPFRPPQNASVTGATPLVSGDNIFITAAYDLGAHLLRFHEGKLENIWSSDESLSLQYSSPVLRDGFLYGLHGRHDFPIGTELRCVELATGKVRWAKPGLKGSNLILAGDSLFVLSETGELIRVSASSANYTEVARAQILGSGVRAYPALSNGRLYARDKDKLVCVQLR